MREVKGSEDLIGRDKYADLDVDGRTMLKLIFTGVVSGVLIQSD
jgi:hypothetical protein